MYLIDYYCSRAVQWLINEGLEEHLQDIKKKKLKPDKLQEKGVALLGLRIVQSEIALYGRMLLTLSLCNNSDNTGTATILPRHRLSPGDIVGIFMASPNPFAVLAHPVDTGVVHEVHKDFIIIAFGYRKKPLIARERLDCLLHSKSLLHVGLVFCDITIRRQIAVLKKMKNAIRDKSPGVSALSCCFGLSRPRFDCRPIKQLLEANDSNSNNRKNRPSWNQSIDTDIEYLVSYRNRMNMSKLNRMQLMCLVLALRALDIACIHGPPGTGKTTILHECILQFAQQGKRVLITAPSNVAVDELLKKWHASGVSATCVRLGHPSKVARELTRYLLEDQEERKAKEPLKSQLVFATCVGVGHYSSALDPFDVVVIDEAGQSTEPACWIPALLGRRLILAGDHHQLAPTVKSSKAEQGLSYSLFERMMNLKSDRNSSISHLLSTQYRMHQYIMKWSNETFYDSLLIADHSCAKRDLRDLIKDSSVTVSLPSPIPCPIPNPVLSPIVWIDTAWNACAREDKQGLNSGTSKSNYFEARVVVKYLEHLTNKIKENDNDKRAKLIGVITPYSGQVELLKRELEKSEF